MNKNLGSLVFLAGLLLLAGVVLLLLQQPVAPGVAPGNAPPSVSARRVQLEDDLRKTGAALARLQTLDLPRQTAGRAPLADVFPELANPLAAARPVQAGTPDPAQSVETGYGMPITRQEGERRATSSSVAPPPSSAVPERLVQPGRLALTYVAADLRRAIVGGRVVHVGDILEDGARVVAIGDASITVRDAEGQRVQLKIARENTATPGEGRP